MPELNDNLPSEILENLTIVISFYAGRPTENLRKLLVDLENFKKQIIIVVNNDNLNDTKIKRNTAGWQTIIRPNQGMNIGAWQEGFLEKSEKKYYFFLQDECFIKKSGFIKTCINRFKENPKLGMLGESLNKKWNHPWQFLAQSSLNWKDKDHEINGSQVPRVDFYVQKMKDLGIDHGASGLHLRSLCWIFRGDVLRFLGGFPIGSNKGECIASEIGVSRKVLQLGYEFDQVAPAPFNFIGHAEWQADGSSKI